MIALELTEEQAAWLAQTIQNHVDGTCEMLEDYSSKKTYNDLVSCWNEAGKSLYNSAYILKQLRK